MRILTVAHNHPSFHPGGTEIVAEQLTAEYARRPDTAVMLLAGLDSRYRRPHAGTHLQGLPGRSEVVLFRSQGFDVFQQVQTRFDSLLFDLAWLLEDFRPDVVHIHHLNHFGVELLALIRRRLPEAAVVYTLHDYYLICPNDGLMATTSGRLCERATPDACHACFPERPSVVFQVRKLNIQRHLALVDLFTAPSAFIRDRFVNWGIPADRIQVIRNGRDWSAPLRATGLNIDERRNRFGIFGNLRRTKGTLVAVEAAVRLVESGFRDFSLDLFGDSLFQEQAFTDELAALMNRSAGRVRVHGRYQPHELPRLMERVDWVMVPSTWWENAPLVIDDSFYFGRPVLCSDIGGMAEAVRDGTDGLHVRAGDPEAWADALRRAATDPEAWRRLAGGIKRPAKVSEAADRHLALFEELRQAKQMPAPAPPREPTPNMVAAARPRASGRKAAL